MSNRALVIGGSVAGLLAAEVLSKYFNKVTIVERDSPSGQASARKGVPQGQHIHLLWSGGMDILEGLFPGLGAELVAAGGEVFDNGADMRWYQHGVWKLRKKMGLLISSQSRPLLESCIFRRVVANPNVELMAGHVLQDLILDSSKEHVIGAIVSPRKTPDVCQSIASNLIIDASGRTATTLRCLKKLGFPMPQEEKVGVDIGYGSCVFERTGGNSRGWCSMAIYAKAPHTYGLGTLFPIEGDRWIVTLAGLRGRYLRSDSHRDFLAYARGLDRSDIYDVIKDATPVGPVHLIHYANQLRRDYRSMGRFPTGLLPIGDSICSLNPMYGQGITVCAQEAMALAESLAGALAENTGRGLREVYLRRITPIVDAAWLLTTGSDFIYPETTGTPPAFAKLLGWYLGRVLHLSASSPLVMKRFLEVVHFQKPVRALMSPTIVAKVIFGARAVPLGNHQY